jgi:Flp pilus assembly protein TadG
MHTRKTITRGGNPVRRISRRPPGLRRAVAPGAAPAGSARRRSRRRGAALVEMAVVTPLLLLMLFGIMEFGWAFMVHENLTNATREAARVGILQGATEQDMEQRFIQAMAGNGIKVTADMLTITPATDEIPRVTVSASVPYSQVTLTGLTSFLGIKRKSIEATCSMHKEGM